MTSATSPEREERAMLDDCWRSRISKVLKILKQDAWKGKQRNLYEPPLATTDWRGVILGGFCPWLFWNQSPSCWHLCFKGCSSALSHLCISHSQLSFGQPLGDGLLGFAHCISQLQLLVFSASLHTPKLHLLLQTHKCVSTDKFSTGSLFSSTPMLLFTSP